MIIFFYNVSENKHFTERKFTGTDVARAIYAKLFYSSDKYYIWVIHSNQMKNCPVIFQDVEVA